MKWEEHYNAFKKYLLENKTETPPSDETTDMANSSKKDKSKMPEDLATWAKKQRREYAKFDKQEKCTITRSRIDKLEALDFDWSESSAADATFELKIQQLQDFRTAHGHVKVPKIHKPNPALGRWVARMREVSDMIKLHDS